MNVDPGIELLEEGMVQPLDLEPGKDPIIPVPPSGGIIIQGADGLNMMVMPDGETILMDQEGNIVEP